MSKGDMVWGALLGGALALLAFNNKEKITSVLQAISKMVKESGRSSKERSNQPESADNNSV